MALKYNKISQNIPNIPKYTKIDIFGMNIYTIWPTWLSALAYKIQLSAVQVARHCSPIPFH
jgi:hypothetical protein